MDTLTLVTDFSFDPEVLKCDIPVLAGFWAEWSVPSQQLISQLPDLAGENPERLKVVSVELENNPRVTADYQVLTIPTLILFKNGLELVRLSGDQSQDSILNAISPYFDQ
jgi:thioredoxin 1